MFSGEGVLCFLIFAASFFWKWKIALFSTVFVLVMHCVPCLWGAKPYEILMWAVISVPLWYAVVFVVSNLLVFLWDLIRRKRNPGPDGHPEPADETAGQMKRRANWLRYLSCAAVELPIVILALGICLERGVGEVNRCVLALYGWGFFNIFFLPTMIWEFEWGRKNGDLSRAKYVLHSLIPLFLPISLHLSKYTGPWLVCLFCGIYFAVNLMMSVTQKKTSAALFLLLFLLQILFFHFYLSID